MYLRMGRKEWCFIGYALWVLIFWVVYCAQYGEGSNFSSGNIDDEVNTWWEEVVPLSLDEYDGTYVVLRTQIQLDSCDSVISPELLEDLEKQIVRVNLFTEKNLGMRQDLSDVQVVCMREASCEETGWRQLKQGDRSYDLVISVPICTSRLSNGNMGGSFQDSACLGKVGISLWAQYRENWYDTVTHELLHALGGRHDPYSQHISIDAHIDQCLNNYLYSLSSVNRYTTMDTTGGGATTCACSGNKCCDGCNLTYSCNTSDAYCCNKCEKQHVTQLCYKGGKIGSCSKTGECMASICSNYTNMTICNSPNTDTCGVYCQKDGVCRPAGNYTVDGVPILNYYEAGTPCSITRNGVCVRRDATNNISQRTDGFHTNIPMVCKLQGYQWQYTAWNTCYQCDSTQSTETRDVFCSKNVKESSGNVVQPVYDTAISSSEIQTHRAQDTRCTTDAKPNATRPCSLNCGYDWRVGSWSSCEGLCGQNGVRTRLVQCVSQQLGSVVDDQFCTAAKPSDSSSGCDVGRRCLVEFGYSADWEPCPTSCSSESEQNRARACVFTDDKSIQVNLDACTPKGTVTMILNVSAVTTNLSRRCENKVGCASKWVVSEWGECLGICKDYAGLKTRTTSCMIDNVVVDNSACERRNMLRYKDEDTWVIQQYGDGEQQPNLKDVCSGVTGDCTYHTVEDGFGDCSAVCGEGVSMVHFRCVLGTTAAIRDRDWYQFLQSNDQTVPEIGDTVPGKCAERQESRPCTSTCTISWVPDEWSSCSTNCQEVQGSRTRQVSCISASGALRSTVDEKECTEEKPVQEESCSGVTECQPTVVTSQWTLCSAACDHTGTSSIGGMRRLEACVRGTDLQGHGLTLGSNTIANVKQEHTLTNQLLVNDEQTTYSLTSTTLELSTEALQYSITLLDPELCSLGESGQINNIRTVRCKRSGCQPNSSSISILSFAATQICITLSILLL